MDETDSMDSGCIPDDVTAILEKEYNFSLTNLKPLKRAMLQTSPQEGLNRRKKKKMKVDIKSINEVTQINGNMTEFEGKQIKKNKDRIKNAIDFNINQNVIDSERKSKTHRNHNKAINIESVDMIKKHGQTINEMTHKINGDIMEFEGKQTKKNKDKSKNAIDFKIKQSRTHTKDDQLVNGEINEMNGNIIKSEAKQMKKNKGENAIDFKIKQSKAQTTDDQVVNEQINEINGNITNFKSKTPKKNKKLKQTGEINENSSKFDSAQVGLPSNHERFENQAMNHIDKSTLEFESEQSLKTKRNHEKMNGRDKNKFESKESKNIKRQHEEMNVFNEKEFESKQSSTSISSMSVHQLMKEKSLAEENLKKLSRVTSGKWFNQAHQLRQQYRLRLRIINKYLYPDLYVNLRLNNDKIREKAKKEGKETGLEMPEKQRAPKETLQDLLKSRHMLQVKMEELKKNIRKDTRPENIQKLRIKIKSGLKTLESRIKREKKRTLANKAIDEAPPEKIFAMIDDINTPSSFTEPLYNKHGKLVYSKFDLANPLKDTLDNNKAKDLKASLQKVLKEKEEINRLKSEGKISEALEQLNRSLWENSMKRIAGDKVKDNPVKIKDSIKRIQKAKQKSAMEWSQRQQIVTNRQRQIQEKKKRNVAVRKERRDAKKKQKKAKWKVPSCVPVPGF